MSKDRKLITNIVFTTTYDINDTFIFNKLFY